MKWTLIGAAALAAACVTACSESGSLVEPSPLPSVQPSSLAPAARQSADSPSLCTSLDPCPGGIDAGPPPEGSCIMITNGIDVVVRGSRQSNGAWLATLVGQVPPGTQPAPPGNEVVGPPPGSGDGSYAVALGDALGRVADVQGRCPNLAFTVGGSAVVTDGFTKYFGLPSPPPPRP